MSLVKLKAINGLNVGNEEVKWRGKDEGTNSKHGLGERKTREENRRSREEKIRGTGRAWIWREEDQRRK